MSIVALKRKTNAQYNNNSVGAKQFSIVGTHRNQGYIGQSTQSRFLIRTLRRGDTARGHGGCCGSYTDTNIIPSEICSMEDSTVVKTSSYGNLGMLLSKYRWARRPAPFSSAKTVVSNRVSQSDYIDRVKKESLQTTAGCQLVNPVNYSNGITRQGRTITSCPDTNPSTEPKKQYWSHSDYLEKLAQQCTVYTKVQNTAGSTTGAPNQCG